nr:hypothetical protein [Mesomycoplasma hyopneumoniae]
MLKSLSLACVSPLILIFIEFWFTLVKSKLVWSDKSLVESDQKLLSVVWFSVLSVFSVFSVLFWLFTTSFFWVFFSTGLTFDSFVGSNLSSLFFG